MVTAYRDAPPLIFLTSSTSSTPKGRNARAHARSESAKRTNPAKANNGSFGSFSIKLKRGGEFKEEDGPRKRRKPVLETVAPVKTPQHVLEKAPPQQTCQLRILATHFQPGGSSLPPNVNFEDVLKVAAFHIKRRAAQVVSSDPGRTLEALRCRQWCSVSSTLASLGRSPYLDSAIACVVSKVQQVISDASSQEKVLTCYTEALHDLREAVRKPALHDKLDMLAATHLLAIYEMLDFPANASWVQHVAGAAAMARLEDPTGSGNSHIAAQAAPMFVEALLSNDNAFFESQHWKSLLNAIVSKRDPIQDPSGETLWSFTELRSLFADVHAATSDGGEMEWPLRMALLGRAHELRSRMMNIVLRSERQVPKTRKSSVVLDTLGLLLVSVMMLDKLILTLRKAISHRGKDLEEETQGLCDQMVRLELAASDADPDKDLLLALKRQAHYPTLSYNG